MNSLIGFDIQRLMNAMQHGQADGSGIVFNTLTFADDQVQTVES